MFDLEQTITVFWVAFVCSWGAGFGIVLTIPFHGRFSMDSDISSVQKYHEIATPRIGGLALLLGLSAGGAYHGYQADQTLQLAGWAGIAVLPVFLGGFFEDVTKRVSAKSRLFLSFFSAAIAFYELDMGLVTIGWTWFDEVLLTLPGVSIVLSVFMVGGLCHAANIIDGFHGLLIGVAVLALISFSIVSIWVGEDLLFLYIVIAIGALLGMLFWNFPKGKLFLGDGGAYLIGFLLALFSLLLVRKSSAISPWFPLLVLSYPIIETIFSIYRKTNIKDMSFMEPDRQHLHMLLYEKLKHSTASNWINPNPLTGACLWGFAVIPMVPALIWWDKSIYLLVFLGAYTVFYMGLYYYLKHSNNPY